MGMAIGLMGFGTRSGSAAKTAAADRTGDKLSAFEAMVARDWDRFWRYAYRLCGNPDDAEDLLSDSLIEAFQAFDSYRGQGFDKWLFRILTTNRIDMTRRAKIRRTESLDSAFADDDGESHGRTIADEDAASRPERRLLDPLYSEELQAALDALPPDFRAAVLLCDVEQMEYSEIAETLGLPIGTVRSRIHRGRTQMRATLEKLGWRG